MFKAVIGSTLALALAVQPALAQQKSQEKSQAEALAERFARSGEAGEKPKTVDRAAKSSPSDKAAKTGGSAAAARPKAPATAPTEIVLADAPAAAQDDEAQGADAEREAYERQRALDEAEMLARANAEAASRQLEELEALAAAKALAEKEAQEARAALKREDEKRKARIDELLAQVAETEARAKAAERQAAAEADARKKAEAALLETTHRADAERKTIEERAKAQGEAAERAAQDAASARARVALVAKTRHLERRLMEIQREAELDRLSRKLDVAEAMRRRADDAPKRDATASPGTEVAAAPDASAWPKSSLPRRIESSQPSEPAVAPNTEVTVLLVMTPGNKGIRRSNPTADPVLCVGEQCYVSAGAARPARPMARWQAFGTINTLGKRADACRNQTTCVFRKVDLETITAKVQPVDLRLMRHDRREVSEVTPDDTCRIRAGQLTCARPLVSETYRLWVVPERLAERAGAASLEQAVRGNLTAAAALD